MANKLWKFTDNLGSFESDHADQIKGLYFPLCNEQLMSSVSPDLHGDIKTGQNSFLLTPVSRIDLTNSKSSRNFWLYINNDKIWSATGVSKNLSQINRDKFNLKAGLLWHKVTRENKDIGLKAEILSFVPASSESVEIMQVEITNISKKKMELIPISAIPIYARSANNLRDHRQVTSLLQRIQVDKYGVIVKPTLVFDESGHRPNKTHYFVLGWDQKFNPPQYIYPTQEMFCGEAGDLEVPLSVSKNILPTKNQIQGREAMGALRFRKINLAPGQSYSFTILMGISEDKAEIKGIINKFKGRPKVAKALVQTKDFWIKKSSQISITTGNSDFDHWFRWVSIQPILRKIFGCSFLPDFDYGKGGRGWRDLWQDCLGLIFTNPNEARKLLVNNFSGVRIDGTNATIIGKKSGEFISDRNNIARVWMDHGVWPLLTLDLYLNETGDFDILLEETAYFSDRGINRSGTILEHLLVQNLAHFFNVGSHNHIRLEGADWNDGLDMAKEFGESVAFSCMYAYNLSLLAQILEKLGRQKIKMAQELKILFSKINYNNIKAKQRVLAEYIQATKSSPSGKKASLDTHLLARDLKAKSKWMTHRIQKTEWLNIGFFNGYYDNQKKRVEGLKNNIIRMILTSQVFPILSGIAKDAQIDKILKNCQKYLWDKKLKGYHLNSDFKEEQHNLGRAFSFVYGDKENGAFFNHMIIMFAYALYKRRFVSAGWRVLSSIYNLAMDTQKSKIYPGLPEYFNLEGRGMYAYLTGSASWFVLTMLNEVFGLKGKDGDLLIEPKLTPEQFKYSSHITINRTFAGRNLEVKFCNPKKLGYGKYRIISAKLNSRNLTLSGTQSVIIARKDILNLMPKRKNSLNIFLG